MKEFKRAKWGYLIFSVLLCMMGLALILWPEISAETFCLLIGAVSLVYGIVKIVSYFTQGARAYSFFQFDLAGGIFLVILGMVFLVHPTYILTVLPVVIGFYMIIDGVEKVETSIDAKRYGLRAWWLILVCALLCAGLGVYLLLNPFEGGALLMMMLGIAILFDGVQNIFDAIYTAKMVKSFHRAFDEPVDVKDYQVK